MKGSYVYGNTAKAMYSQVAPRTVTQERIQERIRRKQEEERRQQEEKEALARYKALRNAHTKNLVYTALAISMAVFMFFVCVQYLETQSQLKTLATEIANMESKLTQMTVKNDETQMEIDASIDYTQLQKTALEELGMVYPSRSQIVEYKANESEYVKQYKVVK